MLFGRINCGLENAKGTHTHRETGMNLFVGMINEVLPADRSICNYWRHFSPDHR